jgi:membrane-associated protease RseP (regulator of RpoE activity)
VGSKYYVENPLFPAEDTVTMLNFDMIGRLRNDELTVFGARSAEEFYAFLDRVNGPAALNLKKVDSSPAMGDHFAFYQRGIPALHFFTGITAEYHTPEDDFETINVPGVVRTIDFAEQVLDLVLAAPARLQFVQGGSARPAAGGMAYLGITPDYAADSEGLRVTAVTEKSPAAEGGIKPGDVILKFADSAVSDLRGLMDGLRKQKPGDIVNIEVRRNQQSVTCSVTLGRPQGS